MFNVMKRTLPLLLAGGVIVSLPATAEAGPPLICHPFDAGASTVLPWGHGEGWNTPDRSYDVRKLTADTLRLLSADAPILARMENMRRATIYAEKNRQVADELLAAVLARATPNARGVQSPIALFDAGYLIETYRQWNMLSEKLDGYGLVKKALEAGPNPNMEFAASLMKEGSVSADHRRRAEAGAVPGSLLAKNLGSHSPMK